MNNLPKTLLLAKKQTDTVAECIVDLPSKFTDLEKYSVFRNTYIYPITDQLIEVTGRFCEYYHSDLLVTIDTIRAAMLSQDDGIYYIGIRKNGIDHNSYVFINLRDKTYASDCYRALYAVEFHRDRDLEIPGQRHIRVCLKDMSMIHYCKEDDDFPLDQIDKELGPEEQKRQLNNK